MPVEQDEMFEKRVELLSKFRKVKTRFKNLP